MKRWLLWLPLVLFGLLVAVAINGLQRPASTLVKSRMVGQMLPKIELPPIMPGSPGLTSADFSTGKPRIINVFASWCVPCAVEAPQLAKLKQAGVVIEGIAVRDKRADLGAFLKRNGNPFASIGNDADGSAQLELGSSGVPETFLIDGKGKIIGQHIGPITDDDVPEILAALEQAK